MKSNNIILDFYAVVVLILGLFAGQTICWLLLDIVGVNPNSGVIFVFAYVVSFLTPIILYNYLVIKKNFGHTLSFSLSSKPISVYLMIFPMMLGMILMADYVTQKIPTEGFFFGDMYDSYTNQLESMSQDPISLIIVTVICAPILEEIIFRGIIQKGLINNGIKPMMAIVFSALIFGAIHVYPWQFVGGFMLSLVLGYVYYKTKSLLMPILLHAFNNLISVVTMLFLETSDLFEILNSRKEYILVLGFVIFAIPTYIFVKNKNTIYQ